MLQGLNNKVTYQEEKEETIYYNIFFHVNVESFFFLLELSNNSFFKIKK